ncbi:MAG: S-layer homology domain-containing protein [Candidatus Ornithomonoglobus sp.]
MIARMLKYSGEYDGRFIDVAADAWYAPEIAALAEKGIINGTSDNTFSPDSEMRYIDMLKILECVLGYASDVQNSADYTDSVMRLAWDLKLIDNTDSFGTSDMINRGDMAILISNALDTHLYTSNVQVRSDNVTIGTAGEDITLIDYINGGRLNGELNAER